MYVDGDHITSFSYSNYDGGQTHEFNGNDLQQFRIGEQKC